MRTINSAQKTRGIFLAFLMWVCFMGDATAQVIDDIILNPDKDGNVVAVIKLAGMVQYVRHFPNSEGKHLEIYFKLLGDGIIDPLQGYEARTSPPSDLIPTFTVAVRDLSTEPKLVLDFSRDAKYSVRIGRIDRSFVITIQSDKPKSAPVEQQKSSAISLAASLPAATAAAAAANANLPATGAVTADNLPQTGLATKQSIPGGAATTPTVPANSSSTLTAIPAVSVAAAVAASTAAVTDPALAKTNAETDAQAEALMTKGREAYKANQLGLAIETFNKVLQLPPNKFSQDAQELVGNARESAGQIFKASQEYKLYMDMYTTGDGVARVKERVAKIQATELAQITGQTAGQTAGAIGGRAGVSPEAKKFQTTENGGISMFYYTGVTLTNVAGQTTQAASIIDQKMLMTNINTSMRARNDEYDMRLVFQDTDTRDFLNRNSTSTPNRIGAAYYDIRDNYLNMSARIGRQSPNGGGVMGRFDGLAMGIGLTKKIQITEAVGQLSDYGAGSKPKFFSFGVALTSSERWGGSVYGVVQNVEGVIDRSAVGGDVRYFNSNKNVYGTWEYDTNFRVLNTAMMQGSLNGTSGTSYNFLLDHRKTPSISLSNAMNGSPSTMSVLVQTYDISYLRELAKDRTAQTNTASLGVTTPLKEKWTAGADISVSNTSGMPQSGSPIGQGSTTTLADGFVAATPSSGNSYNINTRLIGNGVLSKNGVSVFSLGYNTSLLTKGETFLVTNHSSFNEKWSADESLRLYRQSSYDSITGLLTSTESIVSPTFRAAYQAKNNLNLEVDGGIDLTNNNPVNGQSSNTSRKYFSFGGRWDF